MQLIVNGKQYEHRGEGNLLSLLAEMGAEPERLAIMINDRIIRWNERHAIVLTEGDRMDIFKLIGGG